MTGDVDDLRRPTCWCIVTPPDNPAGIESLDDLEGTTWVRCADEVPCGRVALGRARGQRRHRRAGQPRGGRPGHARQGHLGRGRRRPRLRHRRGRRGRRRRRRWRSPAPRPSRRPTSSPSLEQSEDADLAQEWVDLVTSDEGRRPPRAGRVRQAVRHLGRRTARRADPLGRPPLLLLVPAALAVFAARRAARRHGRGDRLAPRLPGQLALRAAARARCGSACPPRPRRCWSAWCSACRVAWLLARVDFRGRGVLRALVTVPLVLPPVVAGIALRTAFGRTGVLGEPLLDADRVRVPLHRLGRRARPRLRVDAVRGDRDRGRAALGRPGVRRRRGHAGRLPVDHLPPGDGAAGAARASWPGWCSAGPARWASSARPSPSTATTPAPRRRCRR